MEEITTLYNEDPRLIVMGKTGAGKSHLLNQLFGENEFDESEDLESFTY